MLRTIPFTGEYAYLTFVGQVNEDKTIVSGTRGCIVSKETSLNLEEFKLMSMCGKFNGNMSNFTFDGIYNFQRNQNKYKFTGKCKYFALDEGTLECENGIKYKVVGGNISEIQGPFTIQFIDKKDSNQYFDYTENFTKTINTRKFQIVGENITGMTDNTGYMKVTWMKSKYLYEGQCAFINVKTLKPVELGSITNLETGKKISGKLADQFENEYTKAIEDFMKD